MAWSSERLLWQDGFGSAALPHTGAQQAWPNALPPSRRRYQSVLLFPEVISRDHNEAAPPNLRRVANGFRRAAGGSHGVQYPLASPLPSTGLGLFGTVSVKVTGRISHLQNTIKCCWSVARGILLTSEDGASIPCLMDIVKLWAHFCAPIGLLVGFPVAPVSRRAFICFAEQGMEVALLPSSDVARRTKERGGMKRSCRLGQRRNEGTGV